MTYFVVAFLSFLVIAELAVILALVNRLLAQAHISGITPDVRGLVHTNVDKPVPIPKKKLFSMTVNA